MRLGAPMLLAQQQPRAVLDVFVALGGLVLAALAIVFVAVIVRKKLRDASEEPASPEAFTIADLRRLKAQGHISDAEFERAKGRIIARSLSGNEPGPSSGESGQAAGDSDNRNNHGSGPN